MSTVKAARVEVRKSGKANADGRQSYAVVLVEPLPHGAQVEEVVACVDSFPNVTSGRDWAVGLIGGKRVYAGPDGVMVAARCSYAYEAAQRVSFPIPAASQIEFVMVGESLEWDARAALVMDIDEAVRS